MHGQPSASDRHVLVFACFPHMPHVSLQAPMVQSDHTPSGGQVTACVVVVGVVVVVVVGIVVVVVVAVVVVVVVVVVVEVVVVMHRTSSVEH